MIFLAIQHLLARKKQSLVTLLGVFIGTTAFIAISSFFQGFQNSLVSTMISSEPHIRVQAQERSIEQKSVERYLFPEYSNFKWIRAPSGIRAAPAIDNPGGWMTRLEKNADVIAATRLYTTSSLVEYNQTTYSLSIVGSEPEKQIKVTDIESKMVSGKFTDLSKGSSRIVIGEELANILAKQIGDNLVLTNPRGDKVPFKIVGIFSTGNRFSDRSSAYVSLVDAQKLGNASGKVSQIAVKVNDYRKASEIADVWKATSVDRVDSWDQLNEGFLSIFKSQDITRYTVTGIILLVASFGIYNILNMVVMQKRKDIAILRSMGYEAKDIIRLFLLQGIFLGVVGGFLGCAIGYLIGLSLGHISLGGPRASTFEITFDITIYFKALLLTNSVTILASYLPARSASNLTPIEIIRGAD